MRYLYVLALWLAASLIPMPHATAAHERATLAPETFGGIHMCNGGYSAMCVEGFAGRKHKPVFRVDCDSRYVECDDEGA